MILMGTIILNICYYLVVNMSNKSHAVSKEKNFHKELEILEGNEESSEKKLKSISEALNFDPEDYEHSKEAFDGLYDMGRGSKILHSSDVNDIIELGLDSASNILGFEMGRKEKNNFLEKMNYKGEEKEGALRSLFFKSRLSPLNGSIILRGNNNLTVLGTSIHEYAHIIERHIRDQSNWEYHKKNYLPSPRSRSEGLATNVQVEGLKNIADQWNDDLIDAHASYLNDRMYLEKEKIENIKEDDFLNYLGLAILRIPEYSRGYCKAREIMREEGEGALHDIAEGEYDGLF